MSLSVAAKPFQPVSIGERERFAMAMFQCPECGTSIADNSVSCPSCGWKNKYQAARKKVNRWSIVSIIFSVIGIIWPFIIDTHQLFYGRLNPVLDINGTRIPLEVVFLIPPLVILITSIVNLVSKSKVLHIVLTILGLIIMWGIVMMIISSGMFYGTSYGYQMPIGAFVVTIAQILCLIASRNLRIPESQQIQPRMAGNSNLEKHRYNAKLQYVDKTPKK